MSSLGITVEEIAAAISTVTKRGYSTEEISDRLRVYLNTRRRVILKDNTEVYMSRGLYEEYKELYNRPEEDTHKEYLDKVMVLEL